MPFFLPSRLIEFDYFGGEEDPQYVTAAEPYRKDIDFAFFAANFGYSKADYESLTPRERAFLYKAWETRMVSDSYNQYNAVFTAIYNANRPKRKKALKLWKKRAVQKADMNVIQNNLEIVSEVEQTEGKDWVRKVYEVNGMRYGKRGG